MKTLNILKSISIPVLLLFSFAKGSEANWLKDKSSGKENNLNSSNTQNTQNSKTDSLPPGVTKEWLKSLRDKEGNSLLKGEDPEGDALQQKTFDGAAPGDQYGTSVASAGDVNGDGFDDVIIGAPRNDTTFPNAGIAYIYYGGTNMNTVADVLLYGEAEAGYFGDAVASAGDVNGDGFADVMVSADEFSVSTGKVYIYYGGVAMNNIADVTMQGVSSSDYFGVSISGAGDVNGDGYSDVIIGMSGYSSFTGRAFIYFGGAVMNNVPDVTITGAVVQDVLGYSVSKAGDVNRDGYADVIVSALGYNTYTGRAYIYYGGAAMNNVADVTLTGENMNDDFGFSVSDAGDINGDGYADVIVGAWGYNTSTGKVYIYYGGAAMNNIVDVTATGEAAYDGFGFTVAATGDINADGYSDVIVGAGGNSGNIGRAYVYYGGSSMNNTADIIMSGEAPGLFGYSVAGAGDVNGDGYADFIVGAYGYGADAGRAYVYTNTLTGDDIPDLFTTGETAGSELGCSVASAGDVNGDGYDDVIVGAYIYSSTLGRAYIFYGGTIMNNVPDVTMTAGNYFGYSVAGAGDVNGDGYDDVIIGSHLYNSYTGRAHIFFGGASMDNIADITFIGESVNSYFGYSVSGAGDVNNDGYADVIIGAYNYSSVVGRAYIYYGGASMNNFADVILTQGYLFGYSVSSAGDVNGDGYDDVIGGSSAYNSYAGRALIFYGGAAMDNVPDVILFGETTNSYFGNSVSKAGDVNNDGYDDVIVGAYAYNSSTGRAYIFYGGVSMNNIADVIMTGETTNNFFGYSVSSAGDVNGDGYDDVISGSFQYNSYTGRAYIFYGGAAMNNAYDVTMTGATNSDFGFSVAGAGDLNGDGKSDVVIGALGYGSSTGRAYIYLSTPPVPHGIINIFMTMEGYYDNVADNMRMSDTVRLYLRNSSSPYTIVDSSKAVINKSNFEGKFSIKNAVTGNYYIVVKHRNSVETWSRLPVSYTYGGSSNYTFVTSILQAYGSNMKQVDTSPARFGIYSGDVNHDGSVNLTDIILIFNDADIFASGYVTTDLTGDNITNLTDLILAFNNAAAFVGKINP